MTPGPGEPIRITLDDLAEPVAAPVARPTQAGEALPPLTPGPAPVAVKASARPDAITRLGATPVISAVVVGLIAGTVGAVLGYWLNHSVVVRPTIENGVLAVTVAPFVGFLLAGWPDLTAGAVAKGLKRGALGAVIGLVAALAAVAVADHLFDRVIADANGDPTSDVTTLKFALWLGWVILASLVGLGLGITGGIRKIVNGLIGGLLGGAVGGLIYVSQVDERAIVITDDSQPFTTTLGPQLVSVVATTVCVCLAIGLVERVARQAWLRVTRGPLSGKEYILYRDSTVIGSGGGCDIVLAKDATVAPRHASIDRQGDRVRIQAESTAPLSVNGRPVTQSALRAGDLIAIASFELTYEER